MAYWRMKLRAGTHGQDMWPLCRDHKVAAIAYNGVQSVDLASYSREHHPAGWNQLKGSAPGSMRYFAWDIHDGDLIYIADSRLKKIVGKGFARAPKRGHGQLAYRFDAASPIVEKNGERWCHLIDVDWDETFAPFPYRPARAPQNTVLGLNQSEIEHFERATLEAEHRQSGLTEKEVQETLLSATAYPRYTPAAQRWIRREHVNLSNQFKIWLENTHGIHALQEHEQIDATFQIGSSRFLVEFKIAYLGNTKRAIREALGQILEYNHYPPRISFDRWLLILDAAPCDRDQAFLHRLRETFGFPLNLGWKAHSGFIFDNPVSFAD